MDKLIQLFEEFILKTIEHTEAMLNLDFSKSNNLDSLGENRDRLLAIMGQIAEQIIWDEIATETKEHLNKQLDYIKRLDEQLLTKLQEYREDLKGDIEKTCRQKEGIKGYNLNDVK